MAYSIVKKMPLDKSISTTHIMHFLADSADDFAFIVDNCAPGSTITIVGDSVDRHKKAPSGKWVHILGSGDELPVNDMEISTPAPTAIYGGKQVAAYQSGVKITKSGLVTGTLHQVTDNPLYGGDQAKGHFFVFDCPTPEGADSITTYKDDEMMRENVTPDGFIMLRIENLEGKEKFKMEFKKAGEVVTSFTFNVSQLTLE